MSSNNELASPCIGVCKLNQQNICCGCGRNIAEIGAWRELSVTQKSVVIELARERCHAMDAQIESRS